MKQIPARFVHTLGTLPGVGTALRWYAKRFEDGSVVRIPRGRAAGLLWKRRHGYVNGYWTGIYELPIQEALFCGLSPGQVFYDIGANAGFFSLISAKLVGVSGEVYSFEPLPDNLRALRQQLSINSLAQCYVVPKAVAKTSGRCLLQLTDNHSTAHLAETGQRLGLSGDIEVETVSIDDFAAHHRSPNLIKIDVEGAEDLVLEGATKLLSSSEAPRLLIELHGEDKARAVNSILQSHGYRFTDLKGAPLEHGVFNEPHVLAFPPTRKAK
jgi:FkbM family methyltransferase